MLSSQQRRWSEMMFESIENAKLRLRKQSASMQQMFQRIGEEQWRVQSSIVVDLHTACLENELRKGVESGA